MDNIIQVHNLKKSFKRQTAVDDVSFTVGKGRILALLGPNGAGKSTTVSILCTCIAPDSGTVTVSGHTLGKHDNAIRRRIGVVFQDGVLDDLLTVKENLELRGRFYGLRGKELESRVLSTAAMTGVFELLGRPYGKLSGGQQRRCDIARALIHFPDILFLDEPATGLDPEMRVAVWQTIRTIRNQRNTTVLLTTHYMEEAALADDVVILKEGRVAAAGTPIGLRSRFSRDMLVMSSTQPDKLAGVLNSRGAAFMQSGHIMSIPLTSTLAALPVLEYCRNLYTDFEVKKGNMEDAYLAIIGAGGER